MRQSAAQPFVNNSSDTVPMPAMPPECAAIAELFPDYVRLACMRVQDASPDVLEAEQPFVEKAVEKRRREFSAGRICARQALRELGCADAPIVQDQTGRPCGRRALWDQSPTATRTRQQLLPIAQERAVLALIWKLYHGYPRRLRAKF